MLSSFLLSTSGEYFVTGSAEITTAEEMHSELYLPSLSLNDAVRYFKENAGGTIPSIKDLKAEKEKLSSLRERQKEEINSLRQYEKELQIAVTNVDAILGPDQNRSREKTEKASPAQEQKRPAAVRRSRGEPSL